MGTWSISPDTGLVSIDNNGLLTYQEHTEDTVYTISYADGTCTASKEITIKGCGGGTSFTKHVSFHFITAAEYINTFLINFFIKRKSDDYVVCRIENIGAYNQPCNPVSQYDEEVDINAECPDGIENYYIEINVQQCNGYNPIDCSHNSGKSHNYFHNGAAMSGQQLTIDNLNDLRSSEAIMSQLRT